MPLFFNTILHFSRINISWERVGCCFGLSFLFVCLLIKKEHNINYKTWSNVWWSFFGEMTGTATFHLLCPLTFTKHFFFLRKISQAITYFLLHLFLYTLLGIKPNNVLSNEIWTMLASFAWQTFYMVYMYTFLFFKCSFIKTKFHCDMFSMDTFNVFVFCFFLFCWRNFVVSNKTTGELFCKRKPSHNSW